jgi:hypothetical protein
VSCHKLSCEVSRRSRQAVNFTERPISDKRPQKLSPLPFLEWRATRAEPIQAGDSVTPSGIAVLQARLPDVGRKGCYGQLSLKTLADYSRRIRSEPEFSTALAEGGAEQSDSHLVDLADTRTNRRVERSWGAGIVSPMPVCALALSVRWPY